MSVVAVASLKGAPGVTTAALSLALTWTGSADVVLAELDIDGGSIASWLGLDQQVGSLSLAAALRRQQDANVVADHVQRLDERLGVLAGPIVGDSARVAVDRVADAVARFGGDERVVVADVGRITNNDLGASFWNTADVSVLVVRPIASELQRLSALLDVLRTASQFRVLLAGNGHYGEDEIAKTLDVVVVGTIADDERAASAIRDGRADVRQLRKSRLLRSAAVVADGLAALTDVDGGSTAERVSA